MKAELTNSLPVLKQLPAESPALIGRPGQPAEAARVTTTVLPADDGAKATPEDAQRSAEELRELAEKLNVGDSSIGRKLRFQFDDAANISVIQVFDRETEQLIRQIPSEEVLERMRNGETDALVLIDTVA